MASTSSDRFFNIVSVQESYKASPRLLTLRVMKRGGSTGIVQIIRSTGTELVSFRVTRQELLELNDLLNDVLHGQEDDQ